MTRKPSLWTEQKCLQWTFETAADEWCRRRVFQASVPDVENAQGPTGTIWHCD